MSDFHFTIDSPAPSPTVLSGDNLVDFCEGRPGEEQRLKDWVTYWRQTKPNFPSVAAGFVRYDGSFWFGIPAKTSRCPAIVESSTFPNHFLQKVPTLVSSSLDEEQYIEAVRCAQEYISSGDIYQVNICRIVSGEWRGDSSQLVSTLRKISQAPYFAHIRFPDYEIISASPELFLDMAGGKITTQPIKGTRRRSNDAALDAHLARELSQCPKEHAELIMITDLERNDLGKICRYGSVQVTELAKQHRFSHVRHLMSTVTGQLLPNISHVDALFSCLPGGSITGAPKIRASEIIAELEPIPRGLYCGVIGYFDLCENAARFSIAIRTIELESKKFRYGVGSGITADSKPAQEWEETLWKSAPLAEALGHHVEVPDSVASGSNN